MEPHLTSSAIALACEAIADVARRLDAVEREASAMRDTLQRQLYILQRASDREFQDEYDRRRAAFAEGAADAPAVEVDEFVATARARFAKQ